MANYMIINGELYNSSSELYHHGVKGMRWGVCRYQNENGKLNTAGIKRRNKTIKKISSMYDHSNKWTDRKTSKLDKKGKTAKADIMREMHKKNEKSKRSQIYNVKKMDAEQYNKARSQALRDYISGVQNWMIGNQIVMMTPLNRLSEYRVQRGIRFVSNITFNKTLKRMTPFEGYQYLDRKRIYGINMFKGIKPFNK